MKSIPADPTSPTLGFATPGEAATYLRLSKGMIHKLIGEQKIPATRYGRAVRIPWAWLRTEAGA